MVKLKQGQVFLFGAIVLVIAFGSNLGLFSTQSCDNYWRVASYPTWIGDLSSHHYDDFNVFFHFNAEPTTSGGLTTNNLGTDSQIRAQIAEAHSRGALMVMVIGGWGYANHFQGATSDTNRGNFVQVVTDRAEELGYDAVNIDWEDGVNNGNLIKLMKELRQELDPNIMLLIDVCCDVQISSMVEIAPYVDSINTMDYQSNPEDYNMQIINAGVPASKLVSGVGFGSGWYVGTSTTRAREQAQWIKDNGLKGIEVWEVSQVGLNDARMNAIKDVFSCDGTGGITRAELGVFITQWINGQITRNTLGGKIVEWVG